MWLKNIILLLCFQVAFSQSQQATLEDKIYNAVDIFVANPTVENLERLEVSEKAFRPKSKPEWLALVILKCNKGYCENQLGLTKKAISSYEKAWEWYQKKQLSNYDIVESCLQPLGNLYTIIGDYDNAENTIKQYYYIAITSKNQQQKYAAILNLSNVYQNTGKVIEAIDLLEKTVTTEKLSPSQKGILLNNLGGNYLLKQKSDDAKKAFETSIHLLSKDNTQSETLSNAYRNLSKLYLQQNNLEKARQYYQQAENAFAKTVNHETRKAARFYYEFAELLYKERKIPEATLQIAKVFNTLIPNYGTNKGVLPNSNSLYAETVLLDAFDLLAEIYLAQNQPNKALESYQLSFHIEDLFQALLVYENSKIISQIRSRNRTEKCIAIYYSLYQKEKKQRYLESAFLVAEATKSAVLKQSLLDATTKTREEKLIREQLQSWSNVILKEQQKMHLAAISKINEAIKKQNELMLLLKSKTRNTVNATKELQLADLYVKLEKDNAVLVEYFIGSEHMYCFTLQNHTLQLQITTAPLGKNLAIRNYLSLFKDANAIANHPKAFNDVAHSAYQFLKLPKKASSKNLIIIPDGILNFLPFEALITSKSATTSFAKMHYLLYEFTIGYSNSAYFYLNASPLQHKKEGVLGVFPLFENSDLELAFSKKELQNIKANFEGNYLDSQKATFENFKLNAGNYSILHLSTHATSGDIIEPASIKFYDQELLYSELYNLNIHPDLVVLSACETGIGKLYKAEGAMSVARGFQFAGAQNLLFSLWKVNDYTTSVFIEKFYGNVKKGHSYFDSNHQAKLDFLADESILNAKKSPYYWSAFVYYGTLEEKESNTNFLWISIVGCIVIVSLICLFLSFRRRRNLIK